MRTIRFAWCAFIRTNVEKHLVNTYFVQKDNYSGCRYCSNSFVRILGKVFLQHPGGTNVFVVHRVTDSQYTVVLSHRELVMIFLAQHM